MSSSNGRQSRLASIPHCQLGRQQTAHACCGRCLPGDRPFHSAPAPSSLATVMHVPSSPLQARGVKAAARHVPLASAAATARVAASAPAGRLTCTWAPRSWVATAASPWRCLQAGTRRRQMSAQPKTLHMWATIWGCLPTSPSAPRGSVMISAVHAAIALAAKVLWKGSTGPPLDATMPHCR